MTRVLTLFIIACLLASCSSAFKKEWQTALKAGPQAGVEGAWQGTWLSATCGHHGNLRCVVGPAKNAQGDREFHYPATWASLVGGAYRSDHRVKGGKGAWTFTGQHDLPRWAGGHYTYAGTIKGDDFNACYQCRKDKGTFQMKRVR